MAKRMTDDEYDKWMLELAIHARNFMRQRGAFLDPKEENETNHGYVTVDEICDVLSITRRVWKQVKFKLIAMGEPLTMDSFGGHYLGRPGSQAKSPAIYFTNALSLFETGMALMAALPGLPDWQECAKTFEDHFSDNRHSFNMKDLPKLLNGAGFKMPEDLEQKLLEG